MSAPPPLPPPLPPPPTEADLAELESFAKRRGARSSGGVRHASKELRANTDDIGHADFLVSKRGTRSRPNPKALTKKVRKSAIRRVLSGGEDESAQLKKPNQPATANVENGKNGALQQQKQQPPPPPPPPPLLSSSIASPSTRAGPRPELQLEKGLHSDFEYECKDDGSQASSPRSRTWTEGSGLGSEVGQDDDLDVPPPLPPLPSALNEESEPGFDMPSPPSALPTFLAPMIDMDDVPPPPPPPPPTQPIATDLEDESESTAQESRVKVPHPPKLSPPAAPNDEDNNSAGAMGEIFDVLRRQRLASTVNEPVSHEDSSVPKLSPPAAPKDEDDNSAGTMGEIFGALRRRRLASTVNEPVSHEDSSVPKLSSPAAPKDEDDSSAGAMDEIVDVLRRRRLASTVNEPVSHEDTSVPKLSSSAAPKEDADDISAGAKYQRMRKAGIPEGAVRHAMRRDGVEPPQESSAASAAPAQAVTGARSAFASRSSQEGMNKYIKMIKAGLPEGVIRHAMARDGVDPPLGLFVEPCVPPIVTVKQVSSSRDDLTADHDVEHANDDEASDAGSVQSSRSLSSTGSQRRLASLRKLSMQRRSSRSLSFAPLTEENEGTTGTIVKSPESPIKQGQEAESEKADPAHSEQEEALRRQSEALERQKEELERKLEQQELEKDALVRSRKPSVRQEETRPQEASPEKEELKRELEEQDLVALAESQKSPVQHEEIRTQESLHKKKELVRKVEQQELEEDAHTQNRKPSVQEERNGTQAASSEKLSKEDEALELKRRKERAERARRSAREQEFRSALVFRRTREHEQISAMVKGYAQELDKAFAGSPTALQEWLLFAEKRKSIAEACLAQVRAKPGLSGTGGLFSIGEDRPRSFSTGFVRRRRPSAHDHDPVELLNKVSHVAHKADKGQREVDETLRESTSARESVAYLKARLARCEAILEQAEIPEDDLRKRLGELEAAHMLQRSLQDAEFQTLQKRREEAADRLALLEREEKARILEAAEQKSAIVLGGVRRKVRIAQQRAEKEHASARAALEERSKGVDAAMQRKTAAEFRRVLAREAAVLKEKKAVLEAQVQDQKQLRVVAEREGAVLARELHQRALPAVKDRHEAETHLDGLRRDVAAEQRARMDRIERKLYAGWSKMRRAGLSEEQAKHKLVLLRKLEACVGATPALVEAYRDQVSKLQEAIPILIADKELARLNQIVDSGVQVLEGHDDFRLDEMAEKNALREINRFSDAIRELREERDERRSAWERRHGANWPL